MANRMDVNYIRYFIPLLGLFLDLLQFTPTRRRRFPRLRLPPLVQEGKK